MCALLTLRKKERYQSLGEGLFSWVRSEKCPPCLSLWESQEITKARFLQLCSHFMPSEQFQRMLRSAAADAGVELRQIEARQQAPDHPILWNVPETDYLKFYLFQVV